MNGNSTIPQTTLLAPPKLPVEDHLQGWFSLPDSDAVISHIRMDLWNQATAPKSWQVARLSSAAYVYCEEQTGWKVVAKFYLSKTGKDALHHAEREFQRTQKAWKCSLSDRNLRSVQPLSLSDGALFLEYVDGLTLEDKIAIRRSQPGELFRAIETVARFLAKLHTNCPQQDLPSDFGPAADYAYKVVDNLVQHGVLQKHLNVKNGLGNLIEKWVEDKRMWDFCQVLSHGDATTTNFIFPPGEGVVSIDWERSEFADPAADLGRLMAEVAHSVKQHGGDFDEGVAFADQLAVAYGNQSTSIWDKERLIHRARFYQATSILRIARNGWLSRQDRLDLVLQAFALFSGKQV